jgi:hypothetical protein
MTMAFLWLAGLALTVAGAHAPVQDKAPDFPAELAALQKEFDEAMEAYYEPYSKAKTDEERAKIRLDADKHPAKQFISRFEDLSERRKSTRRMRSTRSSPATSTLRSSWSSLNSFRRPSG